MNPNSNTISAVAADEGRIRELYRQLMEGWNATSGDAFAAHLKKMVIS